MTKCKILLLAANPETTTQLALDEESREIDQKVRAAEYRDALEVITKWAVRPDDLLQYLNQHRPHVVHFSSHGSATEEILLLDASGLPKPVSKAALRQLFATLKDNIRVVVLNACFSHPQAEAIAEVIDCAVGMKRAIGDQAAIVFAAAFYRALGFGRSVREAFDQGKTALMLEGISEEDTPELFVRGGIDAGTVFLVQRGDFSADLQEGASNTDQRLPARRSDSAPLPTSSAPERSLRQRQPRDYLDGIVRHVATELERARPLTLPVLFRQLNELFNRSTFRFEPLKKCLTREWGARLHAAMQTLEVLRVYSPFVSEHALASHAQTYEVLMDEVNEYCQMMAVHLFQQTAQISVLREDVGAPEFNARLPKPKKFPDGVDTETDEKVDGPRIRAISQMDKLCRVYSSVGKTATESGALGLWREKLAFLQQQEAIAADPNQKFALKKQIEEAQAKIQELGS